MANQAFSRSDDLMVGAGVLYFQRSDDPNGWHHLGNVDEFTINNNIETIEKNSSMNKKRELMASVVTAVSPTGSITMTEYNPYDLALGLYGTEGVLNQAGHTVTNQGYTVASVPGIITVTDADGNRCMDISNVVLAPSSPTPVTFLFNGVLATGNTFTDTQGGEITLNVGSANPTEETEVYISLEAPNTPVVGDLDGYTFHVKEGVFGSIQTHTFTSTQTTAYTWTLASGAEIIIDPSNSTDTNGPFIASGQYHGVDPISSQLVAKLTPSLTEYKEGRDYIADVQELRAGVIKIKSGGVIKKGDTVLVSCTVPEKKFITVSGADAGDIEGKLLFIGDPNIGGQYNIEGWKVKITPDGDLTGLIGTDFGTYTLQVRFLTDYENHPDYPYYRATLINRSSGDSSKAGVYDPEY